MITDKYYKYFPIKLTSVFQNQKYLDIIGNSCYITIDYPHLIFTQIFNINDNDCIN